MRFFHDQEFLENGTTIEPISIGIVAEDGQRYYRVFADWMRSPAVLSDVRRHSFIMREVVPHLPELARKIVMTGWPEGINPDQFPSHPIIAPKWQIAYEVERFIRSYGADRDQHELWTWYGAYDHVMLAQMYGPMVQLPSCIPMYTNDLKAFVAHFERESGTKVPLPEQQGEHNALADAEWNRDAWRAWTLARANHHRDHVMLHASPAPYDRLVGGLVAVPERVFVAGYERLTSQGPNKGLALADQADCEALWRAL